MDKRTPDEIARVSAFWTDARRYVRLNSDDADNPAWVGLQRDDRRLAAWVDYFLWRLRFVPAGVRHLHAGRINEFLVPAARPELFDESYSGPRAPIDVGE